MLLSEDREKLLYATLEKIFIETGYTKTRSTKKRQARRRYRSYRQPSGTVQAILHPREITRDDILRLLEIKMKRILRFNSDEAEEAIAALRKKD